jgi:hypothetical protein
MTERASESKSARPCRVAIDIGSTVVKIAEVGERDRLLSQAFHPRDFEAGIARQVEALLRSLSVPPDDRGVLVCSSANGGLRVGIVCLSKRFSGASMRDQVLLAGANPIFVHDLDEEGGSHQHVDMLMVGGGIDCPDAGPLEARLERFSPDRYRYGALVYAGNRYLAERFVGRFPNASLFPNPLSESLSGSRPSVFEGVRRAYLDDLVFKEGVSELRAGLRGNIRPTPEIVSRGFQRALSGSSAIDISGASAVLDIGGATTDVHYTVEIVRDDSDDKPAVSSSVARYVFTDLGIAASRDSLLLQLRGHHRLYEFLGSVLDDEAGEAYRLLREGEYEPTEEILSYACLFLALARFAEGRGPGVPKADLGRVSQLILTGGASQKLSEDRVSRVVNLLRPKMSGPCAVLIDRRYRLWVDGITWSGSASHQDGTDREG